RGYHRAADDHVCRFASELGAVARARLLEVERIARDHLDGRDALEPIRREELLARLARRDVVVVDVRPAEEYRAGHVPGAISLPLPELERRLRRLSKDALIVAYCRGPYCLLAPQAVAILRSRGFRARRLEDGLPEWRAAGYPVSVEAAS
ncbi:MAG: rhodanese-like domain-containing protein, partial [Chloroflexota bacterium]